MNYRSVLALCSIAFVVVATSAQSGRKSIKPGSPAVATPTPEPTPEEKPALKRQVVAVPGEDYKCTDDGSLAVVVKSEQPEQVFSNKEVTTKAKITSRPMAKYTSDARRRAVEGNVVIRVVLGADGKVSAVRITRGLPLGLNENAIQAACQIKFTPAMKEGQPVSQWQQVEYPFRLNSSIFRQ